MSTFVIAFVFPAASTIVGWFVFGSIGTIAVGYGKMKEEWIPAGLGVALMVYPYFLPNGFGFWLAGIVLTTLLFVPRKFLGGQ